MTTKQLLLLVLTLFFTTATNASSNFHHQPFLTIRGGDRQPIPPSPLVKNAPAVVKKTTQAATSTDAQQHHDDGHKMGPLTAIANIMADLCPHGMLPLAYGMSAAGGTGPAIAISSLIIFGLLSWYSLISFGRAADTVFSPEEEEEDSLSAVWSRVMPNGTTTSWIPDVGCFLLTFGCCIFYSAFIGDLFGALASSGIGSALPKQLRCRTGVLIVLHLFPILPLCLLKDLSALMYSSLLGLLGIMYTVSFVMRRFLDQSYSATGEFYESMESHLQPLAQSQFPGSGKNFLKDLPLFHVGSGILTLMNMCCVAFACHYNAVKYYMELKNPTVPKYGKVVGAGLTGTGCVFLLMMLFGYAAFGANSQALLLNNYHKSKDVLANLARAFTGLAILSGYPLMFAGLKSSLFSLLGLLNRATNVKNREEKKTFLSVLTLAIICVSACFVTEHELATVIGIVGSVFGSAVVYILPAIINQNLIQKGRVAAFFSGELLLNKALVLFGFIFAILGTWVSLAEGGGEHH